MDANEERTRQVVVFGVAGETYGIDVAVVWEIIRMAEITTMPSAPEDVAGMINLRGKVIPVIDLRRRLGLEAQSPGKDSRIAVVDVDGEDVGLIVDQVSEVMRIPQTAIEPAAALTADAAAFVEGVANLEGRLIVLLNLGRLFADDLRVPQPEPVLAGAVAESDDAA